jgi:hypothetical protein
LGAAGTWWHFTLRSSGATGGPCASGRSRCGTGCRRPNGSGQPAGAAPVVVDIPEEPHETFPDSLMTWADAFPPELRQMLAEYLDAEFLAAIEADLARRSTKTSHACRRGRPRSEESSLLDASTA